MQNSFQRFCQVASAHPDRPAIKDRSGVYTYRFLSQYANGLAQELSIHGVALGDRVAIAIEPSVHLIAAQIAVMQLGAAYVPLDPTANPKRNLLIVKDCTPKLGLICEWNYAKLFEGYCEVFDVKHTQGKNEGPIKTVSEIYHAYLIYTSGSTGQPKGVPISHRNLNALFEATEKKFSFSSKDCGVFYHSCAFDFSVWEIWSMLRNGGCLCIPTYSERTNAAEFSRFLDRHEVTILNQTPTSFRINAAEIAKTRCAQTTLRAIVFGGERLDFSSFKDWDEKIGIDAVKLINMYGITETTVHTTYYAIKPSDIESTESIIGEVLDGFKYRIEPTDVSDGSADGELLLSGPQVCEGYLKRTEQTKARFVDLSGTIYYRSGDVVHEKQDGTLVYKGRIDDQMSINGHRVETGEISAALMSDEVKDLAIVSQDSAYGQLLVCFFVASSTCKNDCNHVRQNLRTAANEKLPVYMRPNKFIEIDELKRTTNGKIDVDGLRSLLK